MGYLQSRLVLTCYSVDPTLLTGVHTILRRAKKWDLIWILTAQNLIKGTDYFHPKNQCRHLAINLLFPVTSSDIILQWRTNHLLSCQDWYTSKKKSYYCNPKISTNLTWYLWLWVKTYLALAFCIWCQVWASLIPEVVPENMHVWDK